MPVWQWVVDSIGVLLLLVLLYGVGLVVRRRWITRHGGTFELSHRVVSAVDDDRRRTASRGWVLGLGRYSGGVLEFFRIFSLSPRALRVLERGDLVYDGQREATGAEAHSLYAGHVVVACHTAAEEFELAMDPAAVTGFLSWLEASPPGRGPRAH